MTAPVDRYFVVLKNQPERASPMGWFETLEAAKAALGERAGSIWKNDSGGSEAGAKVYEQS
jgi:hypothetical protein